MRIPPSFISALIKGAILKNGRRHINKAVFFTACRRKMIEHLNYADTAVVLSMGFLYVWLE